MKKVLESRMQREEQSKQRAQSIGMALVVRWTGAGCALDKRWKKRWRHPALLEIQQEVSWALVQRWRHQRFGTEAARVLPGAGGALVCRSSDLLRACLVYLSAPSFHFRETLHNSFGIAL